MLALLRNWFGTLIKWLSGNPFAREDQITNPTYLRLGGNIIYRNDRSRKSSLKLITLRGYDSGEDFLVYNTANNRREKITFVSVSAKPNRGGNWKKNVWLSRKPAFKLKGSV